MQGWRSQRDRLQRARQTLRCPSIESSIVRPIAAPISILMPCNRIAVLVVPKVPLTWLDLDHRDARIVYALGEPCLDHRIPQLRDAHPVTCDRGSAAQMQEARVRRRLHVKRDRGIPFEVGVVQKKQVSERETSS